MFTHNLHATLAHQFVVVQQRACDGVLNRHHADDVRVLLHLFEHLLERVTAHQLDVLVLEVTVARHIVVTSHLSLYRYSSHILYIMYKPHSFERGYIVVLLYLLHDCNTHNYPLLLVAKVKVKIVICVKQ